MEIRLSRGAVSLIFGILGLTFLPILASIVAILVGRKSPQDSLAKAGVILGWIGIGLSLAACCLGAVGGLASGLARFWEEPEGAEGDLTPAAAPVLEIPTAMPAPKEGYLGVRCEDARDGARVTEVIPGSPAEGAGLQAGDVIVRVDTSSIRSCSDLARAVRRRPGETVEMVVQRDGTNVSLTFVLGIR